MVSVLPPSSRLSERRSARAAAIIRKRIHAVVRVKPMVFRGKNGIHQRLGEVLVTNQATLRAACAKEGGDGLGLKPVGLQGGHIVE